MVGETEQQCYRELLCKEITSFRFRPTERPEPLQLKIKLATPGSWGLYPGKKQRLLSDLDSLSSEQEIIDLPTIETNMEREATPKQTSESQAEVGTQTEFSKYLL